MTFQVKKEMKLYIPTSLQKATATPNKFLIQEINGGKKSFKWFLVGSLSDLRSLEFVEISKFVINKFGLSIKGWHWWVGSLDEL